ncbi:hypothetical protein DFH09DRAFT_1127313 [Mycena vulgaris]|nr:hypothetical protein DFH09DRAFT_1127313 [Mycena vulgaris]
MPELPIELEREIFEWATRSNRGNAACKLNFSLVACRVQSWVDLVFYESIKISGPEHAHTFLGLVGSEKYHGFFARAVKILFLVDVRGEQAVHILSACTGVQVLGYWNDRHSDLPLLLSRLPLQRLCTHFDQFSIIPSTPGPAAWLTGLTHLDLVFSDHLPVPDLSPSLRRLPRLTHVGLSCSTAHPFHAEIVCSSCPSLQVLLIVIDNGENQDEVANDFPSDPHIVFIVDFLDGFDFEATYCGPGDLWARADEVMAQRKADLVVSSD